VEDVNARIGCLQGSDNHKTGLHGQLGAADYASVERV
jgi:hypothetical protein